MKLKRKEIFTLAGFALLTFIAGTIVKAQIAGPSPGRPAFATEQRTQGRLWIKLIKSPQHSALSTQQAARTYFYGPYKNLIVTAGKNFLVDAWQNLVELEIMKYHGLGTGTTAANVADTACETELTTQYNPDNTRATGSLTEGATANVFRTVGTNTVDATAAVTEWCLLSQAATGGGTMWSRVVFAAINLSSGDSLQTTYDLTVN